MKAIAIIMCAMVAVTGSLYASTLDAVKLNQKYQADYDCYVDTCVPQADSFHIGKRLKFNGRDYPGVDAFEVSYRSDGYTIYGVLLKPRKRGRLPVVVYNHGGVRGIPETSLRWNLDMAKMGFVVIMSAYRGEPLFFDNSKKIVINSKNPRSEGPRGHYDEVHDVLNLIACAMTLPYVDQKNIFMFGTSHGGLLTLLAVERSNEIRAAASYYGYLSMVRGYAAYLNSPEQVSKGIFTSTFRDMTFAQQLDYIHKADPLLCVERINTPLLIVYGDRDDHKIVEGQEDLLVLLDTHNKKYTLKVYEGERHGFNWYQTPKQKTGNRADSFLLLLDFFRGNYHKDPSL